MRFARAARHLTDGELLRLLDGDGAGAELARFDGHAAGCSRCREGLRSLRRAAWIVHEGLQGAGEPGPHEVHVPPVPRARSTVPVWNRAWARAAVLLLALAGALIAVAPLRARILGWVAARWEELAGSRPTPKAPPAPVLSTAPAPSVLWFTPASGQLRLVLSRRQAAGTLVLERARGPAASLEIVPPDPTVVPLASERLLEIRNRAGTRSGYIVRVPATTTEVVLAIGTESSRTIRAAALAAGQRVELGAAGQAPHRSRRNRSYRPGGAE